MTSPTPNKGYTYPAHGGAVGAWDTPLNTNFDQIDLNVGGVYLLTYTATAVTVTYNATNATFSSTVTTLTLPAANAQNLTYVLSNSTQALSLVFPGNVGGFYNIWNNGTNGFSVTALTTVVGSSGIAIPAGYKMIVCSDGTNMKEGDNYFSSLLGTSGTKIPLLDGNNTWSGTNTYTGQLMTSSALVASASATFNSSTVFNGPMTISSAATSSYSGGVGAFNTVKAYATFNSSPAAVTFTSSIQGFNVATISYTSTGVYPVTFSTPISSQYTVIVGGWNSQNSAQALIGYATSRSTTGFTLTYLRPADNLARDAGPADFMVLGHSTY